MHSEKFTTTSMTISAILGLIKAEDIAIPEIQRPFVWKNKQVRDLMDSLYQGYPVGYIILWKNPNVKLKDGTISAGKKVLIDGQQRVTALMTAIAGRSIFNSDYKLCRVKIAFDPIAALKDDPEAEIFAVQTPAHVKSKNWIPDIAEIFDDNFRSYKFINEYCTKNPEMNPDDLDFIIGKLKAICNQSIGIIELSDTLEIDVVTDIFVRINSKGTTLNQGDFVMSKIAADEDHGGNTLRKIIDYFSHLAKVPSYYDYLISHDTDFCSKPEQYIKKLEWLKDDSETVFDPECDDIIRVAFMHQFHRAKLAELVKMLSGRDFDTREFKEEIIEDTYDKLYKGVAEFINEHNFKQFVITIKSAGFISNKLINSNMAIDFAYALYLILHESKEVSVSEIKRIVQRWYVLSVLTGRYSSSPESAFAKDLRQISEMGVVKTLENIEAAILSDNFWNIQIPQDLTNTSTNNPTYLVYLAAQVYFNDVSLLSQNICVKELIELGGDVHHIFPKQYLKDNGFEKNQYNQEANYAYLDRPVNVSIGKQAPIDYFCVAREQCETKVVKCGSITDIDELKRNLLVNCVPEEVFDMDHTRYAEFLEKRRVLMAQKIKKYYYGL
ncbi:MAG: DUF262 domain-containing protein [Rikenellaceae bacterium]|nr:DUF262 domain-containing protein [Rikenellaceae bacterium]